MTAPGTYVGLRVLEPFNSLLYSHCTDAGVIVKKSMFDRRLHVTVLYSKKHCENIVVSPARHEAEFIDFDVFGSGESSALVVKLNAPSIMARHIQLMALHSAVHDFPVFTPHITLTYSYSGLNFLKLPPITFPIELGDEYVEDLKRDWAKTAEAST